MVAFVHSFHTDPILNGSMMKKIDGTMDEIKNENSDKCNSSNTTMV